MGHRTIWLRTRWCKRDRTRCDPRVRQRSRIRAQLWAPIHIQLRTPKPTPPIPSIRLRKLQRTPRRLRQHRPAKPRSKPIPAWIHPLHHHRKIHTTDARRDTDDARHAHVRRSRRGGHPARRLLACVYAERAGVLHCAKQQCGPILSTRRCGTGGRVADPAAASAAEADGDYADARIGGGIGIGIQEMMIGFVV